MKIKSLLDYQKSLKTLRLGFNSDVNWPNLLQKSEDCNKILYIPHSYIYGPLLSLYIFFTDAFEIIPQKTNLTSIFDFL